MSQPTFKDGPIKHGPQLCAWCRVHYCERRAGLRWKDCCSIECALDAEFAPQKAVLDAKDAELDRRVEENTMKTIFYNVIINWGRSSTSSLLLTREAADRAAKDAKDRGALDTKIERVERTLEAAISEIFQGI